MVSSDWVRIVLIRHGETQWNTEKKIQGAGKDIELNNEGHYQARCLAKRVLTHAQEFGNFHKIYSSPLLRASQTANIISNQLGSSAPTIYTAALKEMHFGTIEGNSHDSTDPSSSWADLVKATQEWQKGNIEYSFKEGESLADVRERCMKFLHSEFESSNDVPNRHWLLISHRGVIKTIFSQLLRQSLLDLDSVFQDNAAFNHLLYCPVTKESKIITWNSTTHLMEK